MKKEIDGMDRRRFIGGSAAGALLVASPLWLAGCATARQYEQAEHMAAQLATGDEWTYEELNGYNRERQAGIRYVVEQADPPRLLVEVDGKPLSGLRSGQFEAYAAPWVVSRDTVYDRDNRYDAPLPVLPARLEPGVREAWQSMVTTDPKERPRRWHVQIDTLGYERVTVPAGEFEALRVRRLIKFEHPDFFRTQSERVEHLWFVPEVKRWVKREWRGQYMPKLRSRHPLLREDWIVWELSRFTVA